ncbi:uncharacterized protein LOC132754756 [Ruditapes philippinarum]|uniref:uncharacterized protein LOC132754756 n=1 Tax=Ruditapes philippinarum TaxID=129788 RepID=UPI00295A8F47|nr:uncharacterized protein LOC132754756 [Ruditapes philippinarum]
MASNNHDTYYHHTDRDSARKILQSGYIKQSDPKQGDAAFGPGTYLTKNGPDKSRSEVARNNYDGITKQFYESKIKEGKVDVAIEVKVPKGTVQPCPASGRDVHLYKGDLKLSDVKEVNVHVRGNDGKVQKYTHK